jgi:hypothetical protein
LFHAWDIAMQYSGAEHGLVRGIDIVKLIHTNGKEGAYLPIKINNRH